ncbi:MAG: PAS domain S-box protein [Chromatiales bacterium]|nr:PAS domain S-box protein [Chromatiales bacterium]
MSLHDLTVGRRLEEKLRLSAAVFSSTHDGVMITDAHGNLMTVNRSFTQITGYSEAETQGKNPRFLRSERHDNDFYQVMWRSIETQVSGKGRSGTGAKTVRLPGSG